MAFVLGGIPRKKKAWTTAGSWEIPSQSSEGNQGHSSEFWASLLVGEV